MKKLAIILMLMLALPLCVSAASYDFEGEDELTAVSNTLGETDKEAEFVDGVIGKAIAFDGKYGLSLGNVGREFSVSALVNMRSNGGANAIFFKNMGDAEKQKWVGVIAQNGKGTLWAHDGVRYGWQVLAQYDRQALNEWTYYVYTEKDGVGTLYVNGKNCGSAEVFADDECELYLCSTFWSGDASNALVDELYIYDYALEEDVIENRYASYAFEMLSVRKTAVTDIELPQTVGGKTVAWSSGDETVIDASGKVTRGETDKTATLYCKIVLGDEIAQKSFDVTVFAKGDGQNERIFADYDFSSVKDGIALDKSGNGNHAQGAENLNSDENGAFYCGEFLKMPMPKTDGVTFEMILTPTASHNNRCAFRIGDTYFTPSNWQNEMWLINDNYTVAYPFGIGNRTRASVVITVEGGIAKLYRDGKLCAEGEFEIAGDDAVIGDFYGYIDKFTVYDYAMSENEIIAKYPVDAQYYSIVIAAVYDDDGHLVSITTSKCGEHEGILLPNSDNVKIFNLK